MWIDTGGIWIQQANSVPALPKSAELVTAPAVVAAALAAVFTILGIVLKDHFLKVVEEKRSEAKLSRSIYERYSNPLATATASLLIRLHEALLREHRLVYLGGGEPAENSNPGGIFRAYKKLSTMYRLAALIGWIRACRREFSYLRIAEPGDVAPIERAISALESALADGGWVEKERVLRLNELWRICSTERLNTANAEGPGVQVDNLIWDSLETNRCEDVSQLEIDAKRRLCRSVADCLTARFNAEYLSADLMEETWAEAIKIIGIREAWVYREWQGAIGDVMIRPVTSATRAFEVIGYGEFEQFSKHGDPTQKLAIGRIREIFHDLDLAVEERFDARPRQLRSIAKASADLLLAIDNVQGAKSIVQPYARGLACEIIRLPM